MLFWNFIIFHQIPVNLQHCLKKHFHVDFFLVNLQVFSNDYSLDETEIFSLKSFMLYTWQGSRYAVPESFIFDVPLGSKYASWIVNYTCKKICLRCLAGFQIYFFQVYYLAKSSILDVWLGSEYNSGTINYFSKILYLRCLTVFWIHFWHV